MTSINQTHHHHHQHVLRPCRKQVITLNATISNINGNVTTSTAAGISQRFNSRGRLHRNSAVDNDSPSLNKEKQYSSVRPSFRRGRQSIDQQSYQAPGNSGMTPSSMNAIPRQIPHSAFEEHICSSQPDVPYSQNTKESDLGTRVKQFFPGEGWIFGTVFSCDWISQNNDNMSDQLSGKLYGSNETEILYHIRYDNNADETLSGYELDELILLSQIEVDSHIVVYSYENNRHFHARIIDTRDDQRDNLLADFETGRQEWIDVRRFKFQLLWSKNFGFSQKRNLCHLEPAPPSNPEAFSGRGKDEHRLDSNEDSNDSSQPVETRGQHPYHKNTNDYSNDRENAHPALQQRAKPQLETKGVQCQTPGENREELIGKSSETNTETGIVVERRVSGDCDTANECVGRNECQDDEASNESSEPSRKGQDPKERRSLSGKETIGGAELLPPDLADLGRGTRLAVFWEQNEEYYAATILKTRRNRTSFNIEYDHDSYREWTDLSAREIYILDDFIAFESRLDAERDGWLSAENIKAWRKASEAKKSAPTCDVACQTDFELSTQLPPEMRVENTREVKRRDAEAAKVCNSSKGLSNTKKPSDDNGGSRKRKFPEWACVESKLKRRGELKFCNKRLISALQVGQRLAIWWPDDKLYFKGTIVKIRREMRNMAYVSYDDGDEEWLDLSEHAFLRLVQDGDDFSNSEQTSSLETSDVEFSSDQEAKTTQELGKECLSLHTPEIKKQPQAALTRDLPDIYKVEVGSRVMVYWNDDDRYYSGTVKKMKPCGQPYFVEYDDGDTEWIDLGRMQFKLAQKSPDTMNRAAKNWKKMSENGEEGKVGRSSRPHHTDKSAETALVDTDDEC